MLHSVHKSRAKHHSITASGDIAPTRNILARVGALVVVGVDEDVGDETVERASRSIHNAAGSLRSHSCRVSAIWIERKRYMNSEICFKGACTRIVIASGTTNAMPLIRFILP